MGRRTLIGALLVLAVVGAWWFDTHVAPGRAWLAATLAAVVMLGSVEELARMIGDDLSHPRLARVFHGVLPLVAFTLYGLSPSPATGTLAVLVALTPIWASAVLAWRMVRGDLGETSAAGASRIRFLVPLGVGVGCFIPLLLQGGLDAVLVLVLVVKASDIGAYYVGKTMGRRKLAPRVSPNKTVEGAVGGLLASALVAVGLTATSLGAGLPGGWVAAGLGAVAAGLAMISDLCESLLKRSVGVKDSGHLFGESGGFLDLADSLLVVAPIALLYTAFDHADVFGLS